MISDTFMHDYSWILMGVIIVFTAFIGYILNKNIDPDEIDQDDEENEFNSKDTDENK
jgi:uncharacterized membrane protein